MNKIIIAKKYEDWLEMRNLLTNGDILIYFKKGRPSDLYDKGLNMGMGICRTEKGFFKVVTPYTRDKGMSIITKQFIIKRLKEEISKLESK